MDYGEGSEDAVKIVSWNVNSLKARAELVGLYLDEVAPPGSHRQLARKGGRAAAFSRAARPLPPCASFFRSLWRTASLEP